MGMSQGRSMGGESGAASIIAMEEATVKTAARDNTSRSSWDKGLSESPPFLPSRVAIAFMRGTDSVAGFSGSLTTTTIGGVGA